VNITILQESKAPRNGAAPAGAAAAGKKAKGWKIREVRKVRARHDAPYQVEDTTYETVVEPDAEEVGEKNQRFENDPGVVDARRQINDRLRRRRCDEAASLLQRLAAEVGGRPVAELALDAGDRCRALGKSNAALSCYLAASRADPVHEEPLLRLADICLDDKDIDLAVSYLERVARIHRLASDHRGALRLYRKIATIAPYRDDILSVLMRAQATGRFDD
jgi:tetratricopeptide (TPR) repeat protein